MRRVVCPLRAVGAAVIVSDNVAKAKESRGAWAVGSERKKSVVDVQLGMSAITPFGRGRTGRFKLIVHKDRSAHLTRPVCGQLVLTSEDDGRCSWRIESGSASTDEGIFRPTGLVDVVGAERPLLPEDIPRLVEVLLAHDDLPRSDDGQAVARADGEVRRLLDARDPRAPQE